MMSRTLPDGWIELEIVKYDWPATLAVKANLISAITESSAPEGTRVTIMFGESKHEVVGKTFSSLWSCLQGMGLPFVLVCSTHGKRIAVRADAVDTIVTVEGAKRVVGVSWSHLGVRCGTDRADDPAVLFRRLNDFLPGVLRGEAK